MESIKIEIKTEPELIINDAPPSEAPYNHTQQDQAGISPINTSFIVIKEEHEYDSEIVKIKEQPVKCEICGKGFKYEDINVHMTLHAKFTVVTDPTLIPERKMEIKPKIEKEESVKCQFCGKGFKKEDLKIHESTHFKTVKSIKCTMCNICNKWFDLKEIERHMLNHRRSQLKAIVESKTKMCVVCGTKHYKPCTPVEEKIEEKPDIKKIKYDEKTLKQIEEDRKINQPEDVPVICKYCGKGFKSHDLKLHEGLHVAANEKTMEEIEEDRKLNQPEDAPVICKYCGKGFKSRDLKLHEGLHEAALQKDLNEGKKPTCLFCYKTFHSKAKLNLHRIRIPKEGGGFYVNCSHRIDSINKSN